LYYLAKEALSLHEIYQSSLDIVEGVNFKLFAVALIYIDDIEDDNIAHLDPKVLISKNDIRAYFESELQLLHLGNQKSSFS
jgi:hypothetical protein